MQELSTGYAEKQCAHSFCHPPIHTQTHTSDILFGKICVEYKQVIKSCVKIITVRKKQCYYNAREHLKEIDHNASGGTMQSGISDHKHPLFLSPCK